MTRKQYAVHTVRDEPVRLRDQLDHIEFRNSGDSAFNSPCETVAARRMAIGASGLIREKCKRHAITGKRSLNWPSAVRTNREQFLDNNGNPR